MTDIAKGAIVLDPSIHLGLSLVADGLKCDLILGCLSGGHVLTRSRALVPSIDAGDSRWRLLSHQMSTLGVIAVLSRWQRLARRPHGRVSQRESLLSTAHLLGRLLKGKLLLAGEVVHHGRWSVIKCLQLGMGHCNSTVSSSSLLLDVLLTRLFFTYAFSILIN